MALLNPYAKGFNHFFQKRRLFVVIFLLIPLFSILFYTMVDKRQMPEISQRESILSIDWNENINIDENRQRIIELCKNLSIEPIQVNTYVGEQQFILNRDMEIDMNESQIYFKLHNSQEVTIVENELRSRLKNEYPNARTNFSPPENIFEKVFSSNEVVLVAEISKESKQSLTSYENITNIIQDIKVKYPDIDISPISKKKYIEILISQEKLILYDVEKANLIKELQNAFNQNKIGEIIDQNNFIPVITGKKQESIDNILKSTFVNNAKNKLIPISSLASIQEKEGYKSIISGKAGSYIPLKISETPVHPETIMTSIREIVNLHNKHELSFSGSWFENKKLLREMSFVLLISLLLLYFILAAQFESLTQPLIVLLEVPIDISGALLLLYLFGNSINIMSMIGIVVMSGIIINDSILKIDTINQLRRQGMNTIEAIKEGGHRRLKPILMTSLTTILALVPFLFGKDLGSELQIPLALTIIGGLGLGTIVSLYFIPIAYYYLAKIGRKQ